MPTEALVPSAVDVVGNDLVLPPGKVKGVVAGTALDEGVNVEQLNAEAYARAVADQDETLAREAADDALATQFGDALTTLEGRQILTGPGLEGGGDLSADLAIGVVFGSTPGTVAAGDDPRFASGGTGGVPPERTLGFLAPAFTGAGDLSADRLIAPVFGDQAGTFCEGDDPRLAGTGGADIVFGDQAGEVCEGNDARLTNTRAPTAHAAAHVGGGVDAIPVATALVAGLMSSADKTKLDGLSSAGAFPFGLWGAAGSPAAVAPKWMPQAFNLAPGVTNNLAHWVIAPMDMTCIGMSASYANAIQATDSLTFTLENANVVQAASVTLTPTNTQVNVSGLNVAIPRGSNLTMRVQQSGSTPSSVGTNTRVSLLCIPLSLAFTVPIAIATIQDAGIAQALGDPQQPGVLVLGTLPITTLTYSRLSNPAYTGSLNQQAVAVLKAKVFGTPYAQICGVGDSMTYGANAGNAADPAGCEGWRNKINDAIIASRGPAVPVEWVGFQNTGFAVNTIISRHNGVGGRLTTGVTANVATELGPNIRLPHIVIYNIGTNDSRSSKVEATFTTDYVASYNAIRARVPSARMVLGFVPENPGEPAFDAFGASYNVTLPATWAGLAGNKHLAAAPPGLLPGDMNMLDKPHPLDAGYTKIAAPLIPQVLAALTAMGI